MSARLAGDPAGEARSRVGRAWEGRGVAPEVLADAERQVAGMLSGLNDLIDAFPMLRNPDDARAQADGTPGAPDAAHLPQAAHATQAAHAAGSGGGDGSRAARPSGSSGSAAPAPTGGALHELPLATLADQLRTRARSPVEVTRALLERIERHDATYKTFILVTADTAIEQARRAEQEIGRGDYKGPLHGVPLAAKDLYDMAGVPTTAGSRILRDWVPPDDSAAVAAWRAAGAVLLGKNTLHEFAFGGTSVNAHTGTPRNPWNPDHMCAGSSGGSAAAVAAGFAYGAFGSETGNSIRRPASFCGVVGLKPTYGRCSRRGVFPLAWSLDHVGVFARTPADAALLTDPLTGFDAADPGSRHAPDGKASVKPEGGVRGRRIGVPHALLTGIDLEVAQAFHAALAALRAEGVTVQDVSLPLASRWTALASSITMQAEAAAVHARWLRERPGDYGHDVLARLIAGSTVTASEYARAQSLRGAVRAELDAALRDLDAFAAPASPTPALPLEGGALVAGDSPFGTAAGAFQLQRMWSLTGLPAVAAPLGLHSNGLPMSIQLAGRDWQESLLLGLADTAMGHRPAPVAPLA